MARFLDVGLTGGIACGKSLALSIFKALGCFVLDADKIYHDLIEPGTSLQKKIVKAFGEEILTRNDEIDRNKLGQIIFRDEAARDKLNRITHPAAIKEQNRIKKEIRKSNKEIEEGIIITDSALMIESGGYKRFEKLVVITCTAERQLQRLMTREKLDEKDALLKISSQMPVAEKAELADYVIENNSEPKQLIRRVEHIHHLLFEDLHKK